MGFENFPSNNSEKIAQITSEEVSKYLNMPVDNAELQAWMQEKGIDFDKGVIEIEVDGEKAEMQTDKEDFGTFKLKNNNEIISSS